MSMRAGLFLVPALVGLFLGGCGETDTTPPPGTDTNTPTVEIDEGIPSPDEPPAEGDAM